MVRRTRIRPCENVEIVALVFEFVGMRLGCVVGVVVVRVMMVMMMVMASM
jgi:hypothetical protein